MKNSKWKIITSIVVLAICIPAVICRSESNTSKDSSTKVSESIELGQPAGRLLYADGIGGLHEIQRNGEVRKVFNLSNHSGKIGYNAALKRYIVFEERYDKHSDVPGVPYRMPTYQLSLHHVDEDGNIDKTIPLPVFQRGINDVSFSSSGRFVIVTANSTDRIIKQRSAEDYDAYHVEDVYRIDTATGTANLLLQGSCRSLGAIHPQKEQFLFTDVHGVICQYDLNKKTPTPLSKGRLLKGSRPYWNSECIAVRYVPQIDWFTQKGDTSYPKQTGDDLYEFEYNIETKKKTKLGRAGDLFVWAPDRKQGVRITHYDTFFKDGWGLGIGLGEVILESSDRKRKTRLIKDIQFPTSIFWIRQRAKTGPAPTP